MSTAEDETISVRDWIATFLILGIPVLNIIMLAAWAFGESTVPSKRNFARAAIVFFAVSIAIGVVIGIFADIAGNASGHPVNPLR